MIHLIGSIEVADFCKKIREHVRIRNRAHLLLVRISSRYAKRVYGLQGLVHSHMEEHLNHKVVYAFINKMKRKVKERNSNVETVKRYRMLYARPILKTIKKYLQREQHIVLPKSTIGVAINYTLKTFDKLEIYVTDGRSEIDNNNIENAIRIAIGRKNYLFAGSHRAAQDYAMFYSFFATCKIHNINPFEWLNHVLRRIPEHKVNKLTELTPIGNHLKIKGGVYFTEPLQNIMFFGFYK